MLTKIAFLSEFDDSINQMLTLRKVGLIKKRIRRILFIIKQKSFSFGLFSSWIKVAFLMINNLIII